MTNETAVCERTKESVRLIDGAFVAHPGTGEWSFISVSAPERFEDYAVPVAALVKSPASLVGWLVHLNRKPWFDSQKFADFFTRFGAVNHLLQLR